MWLFHYVNFERNYDVLKLKSRSILLKKNINFQKNETESKMENPTHSFREKNFVLQLIYKSQIKSKTVMSWSSRRIKEGIFFTVYLSKGNFFKIFDLSQCIVHWIQFPNLHTFTYQKILLHIHFWLFLISLKVFSVSLIHCGFLLPLNYGVDSNNFRIAKYAITFP